MAVLSWRFLLVISSLARSLHQRLFRLLIPAAILQWKLAAQLGQRRHLQAVAGWIDEDFAGHQVLLHRPDAIDRAIQSGYGGDGQGGGERWGARPEGARGV